MALKKKKEEEEELVGFPNNYRDMTFSFLPKFHFFMIKLFLYLSLNKHNFDTRY